MIANDNLNGHKPLPDDESSYGVGLSDPYLSEPRRIALDLVNQLHSTGVQVDIDLPQIAVIGSQSTGKSSLIEAISGVTLPRAAGTCTRCPTECRLSRSNGRWNCIVSLRWLKDATGQVQGKVKNEIFGPTIYSIGEVEDRVCRAQRAILNPSKPSEQFLSGTFDDNDENELRFSVNCVTLQISGPGVADLSFCDLPGLIASTGNRGNHDDIVLIENLVTSYIKKSSCIILLTVACETDFENQGAHTLAKLHDPEGQRTIGVLTKPDRIAAGDESRWISFVLNEREPLENNWYCVKQPSSTDLKKGVTWLQAREQENNFFSLTPPWSDLDSTYQKYLRTANLVERLSEILSDLIQKRLPRIQAELEKAITTTAQAIARLPKEPSKDPSNEIATLLHEFVTDLNKQIDGIPNNGDLLHKIRPAQEKFRKEIQATAPKFRPFESRKDDRKPLERPVFLKDEEEAEEPTAEDEIVDGIDNVEDRVIDEGGDKKADAGRQLPDNEPNDVIYVDQVLEQAYRARTRELPGNYPFVVQNDYIDRTVKKWNLPAERLCEELHATVTDHVQALIHNHFSGFGQGALEQNVRIILNEHIRRCYDGARNQVKWLWEMEHAPFTLNAHYYADYSDKFLAYYKGVREKEHNKTLMNAIKGYSPPRKDSPNKNGWGTTDFPKGIAGVLSALADLDIHGTKPEDIPKILPADKMEPALIIMAQVRAYCQVAYKRFTDNVPMAIDKELVYGIQRNLLLTLNTQLGINGRDGERKCQELATESPRNARRRRELQKKLERLKIARNELVSGWAKIVPLAYLQNQL